jgi:hypothetical protein
MIHAVYKYVLSISVAAIIIVAPLQKLHASPDVNPNDPIGGVPFTVAEGFEILRATGCLNRYIHGDGIKTERAIARLLFEAKDCLKDYNGDGWEGRELARQVWRRMKKQYSYAYEIETKRIKPKWNKPHLNMPILRFNYMAFSNDATKFPSTRIDAITSPFTAYREGIEYRPTHNVFFSFKSAFSLGNWFDLQIEPIFLTHFNDFKPDIHSGTIKFTVRNFEFKGGRSPIYWGPGRGKTNIFSGNTKPMEMVQIGNPYPFKSFPLQYRILFGYISDDDRHIPHPFIFAFRVNMKPIPTVEVGLTRAMMFGGEGAPSYNPFAPLAELLGFRPWDGWIFNIPFTKDAIGGTSGFANNNLSIDIRWRIPSWRNSELFFEFYTEDPFDIVDFLPEDGILHGGLWIPRLSRTGDWQLLVEGTYSADIVYSHSTFRSGFTNRRRIMGQDLGPDGIEFHVYIAKILNSKNKMWGSATFQHHFISSIYDDIQISDPRGESRLILMLGSSHAINDNLKLNFTGGVQRIGNFNFENGRIKNSLMGALDIYYQF